MEFWKISSLDFSRFNYLVWLTGSVIRGRGFSSCRDVIGVPSIFCIMGARILFTSYHEEEKIFRICWKEVGDLDIEGQHFWILGEEFSILDFWGV